MKPIVIAAAMQLALVAPAFAQQARSGDVVVRPPAEYIERQAEGFASAVTAPTPHEQMPRWNRSVCPGVIGMRPELAQAFIDRVAQTALHVGLDVGEPGCDANVFIFFTRNAGAVATQIAETRSASGRGESGNSLGRAALQDFTETARPVRWWHVAATSTNDGFLVEAGESSRVRTAGRMRSNTRQDIERAFIVIDAERVSGVQIAALADYVAMASLSQLSPDAEVTGAQTILGLFSGEGATRPASLTTWDLAYLEGLYAADGDAASQRQQQREIVREMREQVAGR
jgi:hypothetical protein